MSLKIEMTVRGVLLAGKWAKESDLPPEGAQDPKILDSWRNGLISAIVASTNQQYYQDEYHVGSVTYFQGFDNERLIGIGAVIVFLLEAGFYDSQTIKSRHDDYLRNDLIGQNNIHIGISVSELQGMSNQKLVRLGLQWFPTSTPKHPHGDGSLVEPTFGDPNNTGIDRTVFGYFQMIFERARADYLASNSEHAQLLLAWINNVFPAIPLKGSTYDKIEPFINSVVGAKSHLEHKRDYYGHAWNHVPLCSLTFYEGRLESFLVSMEKIEKKYQSYISASRTDDERHSDYVSALEETKFLCGALEEERENTLSLINQTASDINAKELEVEAVKPMLLEKMRGLSGDIQKCFSAPSAEQLAGILLNLSFMPEKQFGQAAMVASQALTAGSDIFGALSKVRMDDGTEVDRSLVINDSISSARA